MKLSALLLCCIAPLFMHAQYYNQMFDGADTIPSSSLLVEIDPDSSNIWQIGNPQKIIFDDASTLPNAIVTDSINFYPVGNSSSFTIEMPGYGNFGIFALQWQQKLDMDQGLDGGLVELSTDNGLTWQNAFNNPYVYNFYGFDQMNFDTLATGEYAFSGTDSTWKDIWLCYDLSWATTVDTIKARFTLLSDSLDTNKEGWMMDNFMSRITLIHTVKEEKKDKYLDVFPNPTTGRVQITARKTDGFHIIEKMELFNIEGKVVQEFENVPTKFFIDIGHHLPGMYYLKIQTNLKTETVPILLQNE